MKSTLTRVLLGLLTLLGSICTYAQTTTLSPLGAQKIAVLIAACATEPTKQPVTVADAKRFVFEHINGYIKEVSYGQAWLEGDAFGWYVVDCTIGSKAMASAADAQATAAGVNLANFQRKIYFFPFGGVAYDGKIAISNYYDILDYINKNIRGGMHTTHELLHTFGLPHANSLECGASILARDGITYEYGDVFSVMGSSMGMAHISAFEREQLGWINAGTNPPVLEVQTSGTYEVSPLEIGDSRTKALKVYRGVDPVTGLKMWYYIEFRRPIGYDSYLFDSTYYKPLTFTSTYPENISNGVLVYLSGGFKQYTPLGVSSKVTAHALLDMNPGSLGKIYSTDTQATTDKRDSQDAALTIGKVFTDPENIVSLEVLSVDSISAKIKVTYGSISSSPAISLAPHIDSVEMLSSTSVLSGLVDIKTIIKGFIGNNLYLILKVDGGAITTGESFSGYTNEKVSLKSIDTTKLEDGTHTLSARVYSFPFGLYGKEKLISFTTKNGSGTGSGTINNSPVAVNDSVSLIANGSATISVVANDYDPDGQSIAVKSVTQGAHGSVSILDASRVVYTPTLDFVGTDSFTYTISDGMASATATVSISVTSSTTKPPRGKGRNK